VERNVDDERLAGGGRVRGVGGEFSWFHRNRVRLQDVPPGAVSAVGVRALPPNDSVEDSGRGGGGNLHVQLQF
jgi:hypothetical protein